MACDYDRTARPYYRREKAKAAVRRSPRISARLKPTPSKNIAVNKAPRKTYPTTPQPRHPKRPREPEDLPTATVPSPKRPRSSADFITARPANRDAQFGRTKTTINPIDHWRKEHTWPKEFYKPDSMSHLLARKRSTHSLRRKRSDPGSLIASSTTPSDQKPREEKSTPYRDARYETLLATKGSFMIHPSRAVPQDSLFRDDLFDSTCRKIRNRNETRAIRDVSPLIVPSVEILATYGARELVTLIESTNEGWSNCIPLSGTRPQPDYSVGFKREAFTEDQLDKLSPFIGNFIAGDQSFFMATYYMYFPFLTCEVKCGGAALDIADRQNAHSMTLAVRAIVELFRLVQREDEVSREILAISVSHDHRSVRIYGHYPVINGPKTTYYRHPVHTIDFTALDGRDKWTSYKIIRNVYETWMPTHFKRICSAIDELPPGLDFDVALVPQDSGLSQDLESCLSHSFPRSASHTEDDDNHSGIGDVTPNTSFTHREVEKRPRKKAAKKGGRAELS